jgi:8-oxo-dGTP diphosphatase
MSLLTWAVAAVIEDPVGRILLCQQSQGHRLWGLPGGKVRHGESPIKAAIRDIREEIGRDVELAHLLGLYHLTGDGCGDDLPDLLVHVFRGRLDGEATVNAPGRISRLAWHEPEALPHPMTAVTRAALGDAGRGHAGVLRHVQRDREPDVPEAIDAPMAPVGGLVAPAPMR